MQSLKDNTELYIDIWSNESKSVMHFYMLDTVTKYFIITDPNILQEGQDYILSNNKNVYEKNKRICKHDDQLGELKHL